MEQKLPNSLSHPQTNITHQPVMLGSASSHTRHAISESTHFNATIMKHVELYSLELCPHAQWFDRKSSVGEKNKLLLTTSPHHNSHAMNQQIRINC